MDTAGDLCRTVDQKVVVGQFFFTVTITSIYFNKPLNVIINY